MTLKITVASEEDAARISDIHMAAFGTNEMLLAQVPTEKARQGLRKCIARKAAGDIKDPRIDVLLVRDTKIDNQAIAYAKWSSPSSTSETETPWIWPDGTRHDILDEWIKILSEADVSIMGNEPCYRKKDPCLIMDIFITVFIGLRQLLIITYASFRPRIHSYSS